jgi:hypothetical protein
MPLGFLESFATRWRKKIDPRNSASLPVSQLFLPLGLAGFFIGLCQCVSETPTDRTGISANLVQFSFLSLSQCRRVIQSYLRDRDRYPRFLSIIYRKKNTTVCSAYLWLFICLFETSSAPSSRPPHPTLKKRKKLSQPIDCETPA